MPSSVESLLSAVGLVHTGSVHWLDPVPEVSQGVYIVTLDEAADALDRAVPTAPISSAAVDELLSACPEITLDGVHPTREQLAARLASYWLPDETVLYIGLAGQPLRTRVRQYYNTRLGAPKPHKGGWWLKTLSVLTNLHVHYAATPDFKSAEEAMLLAFAANVSDTSRDQLLKNDPIMPFANLRDGNWQRRKHGIKAVTASEQKPPKAPPSPRVTPSPASALPGRASRVRTAHHKSQKVTEADIRAGQVRVPRGATKTVLPPDRMDLRVVLRGEDVGSCRWDPRFGPPERSGVIRVGRTAATRLLAADDVLAVTVVDGEVVALD